MTIKLKTSDVAGKAPSLEDLILGELAVNTTDGDIYLKRDNNGEVTIERFTRDNPVDSIIFVQKSGSDENRGTSWDDAYLTIEQALEDAWTRDNEIVMIEIGPGIYETKGHLDMPDNSIVHCVYRSVKIRPVEGYEERNVFRMGSGCFIEGPVFEGWRIDDFDNPSEGFAAVFRPGSLITRTPYVHKIAVRSIPTWTQIAPPLDRNNGNPYVPRGGGVVMADGNVISPYSIYPNIMTWGATPVIHNGVGYVAKNGALINAVNAISIWAHKHFYAINGGQIVLSACSTQFGDYTLVAEGVREIIDPYLMEQAFESNSTAADQIYNSSNTIIDGMWNELETQGYTTTWPASYEEMTRKDANLLMRSLSWTLASADQKPVADFSKGFFDAQGDRTFIPQEYDFDKCFRDTGLITDAIAYDVLFGNNVRSTTAALSYYRANAADVLGDQLQNTIDSITRQKSTLGGYLSGAAKVRSDDLFDGVLDIISNGPDANSQVILPDPTPFDTNFEEARRLLVDNKEFIQKEIDAWIKYQIDNDIAPFDSNRVFTYDKTLCSRDVGLIVDALSYDLMFGSNFRAISAGRAYYRASSNKVVENQKAETLRALRYLKTLVSNRVSGNAAAVTSVEAGMDIIIDILDNGLSAEPTIDIPAPSGGSNNASDVGYLNAVNNIEANKDFVKEEITAFLEDKYPAIEYDREKCQRDVDYIIDAVKFDLTYGGNLETLIAANSYYSGAVLQFGVEEKTPTIESYAYASQLLQSIIEDQQFETPYQNVVTQTLTGSAGSNDAAIALASLFIDITNTLWEGEAQSESLPDTSWVSASLMTSYNDLQGSKATIQNEVIQYIDIYFTRDFYDRDLCYRDVGLIVDAVAYDMVFGSDFRTTTAARAYYRDGAAVVTQFQKEVTVAALEFLRERLAGIVAPTSATAETSVRDNVNTIINTLENGTGDLPSAINDYQIPTPTAGTNNAFVTDYQNARDSIQTNRVGLKGMIITYIEDNYPAVASTYDQALCERDIDYIFDALYYDLTYGGNLESFIAANAYYSGSALQLGTNEKNATIAAYEYMRNQVGAVAEAASNVTIGNEVEAKIQLVIDAVQNGPISESNKIAPSITWADADLQTAYGDLIDDRANSQEAVIDYVDTEFVYFYDVALCKRDVGLIIDAVSYDAIFDSDFRTVTAGRSYYRDGAAVVTSAQKDLTISALTYLKGIIVDDSTNHDATIAQRIGDRMDQIIDILDNGIDNIPSSIIEYQITDPTAGANNASDTDYEAARDAIESSRSTLKSDVIDYIKANYPGVANTYLQSSCERDIDYILNAVYYDMTFGGNLETAVAARSYYSNAVLQLGDGEKTATIDAYTFLKGEITTVATNASNATVGAVAGALIQDVIDTIDTGEDPTITEPDVTWLSPTFIDAFNSLESNKEASKDSVIEFTNTKVSRNYDRDLCSRDVGLIVDAIMYDIAFGSNFRTTVAARSYYRSVSKAVLGSQKAMTVSAIEHLKKVMIETLGDILGGLTISITTLADLIISAILNGDDVLPSLISEYDLPNPPGGTNNASDADIRNARNSIETNRATIVSDVISYIQTNHPTIAASYDQEACERDVNFILDAIYYDMTYGGTLETTVAANAYYSGSILQLGDGEKTATLDTYAYMQTQIGTIATNASNSTVGASVEGLMDIIIDTIDTGTAPTVVEPDRSWIGLSQENAFVEAQSLKTTYQQSVIDFVDTEFVYGYDTAKCRRDVDYIVDALRYDMTYGGNLETYTAASAYFVGSSAQYGIGEAQMTTAALGRLSNILIDILQGNEITRSYKNELVQDVSGTPGNLAAATFASTRVGEIISTINNAGSLPVKIYPDTTWPDIGYQDAFNTINTNKTDITIDVMDYISKETKSILGAFLTAYDYIEGEIANLSNVGATEEAIISSIFYNIKKTIMDPSKIEEPSVITAIGHTWSAIMAGVALTKIPPANNETNITESILELDRGTVIASGQDDQGSALFVGGMEINADTGELSGPPFQQAVNRISTRAAISRSF